MSVAHPWNVGLLFDDRRDAKRPEGEREAKPEGEDRRPVLAALRALSGYGREEEDRPTLEERWAAERERLERFRSPLAPQPLQPRQPLQPLQPLQARMPAGLRRYV